MQGSAFKSLSLSARPTNPEIVAGVARNQTWHCTALHCTMSLVTGRNAGTLLWALASLGPKPQLPQTPTAHSERILKPSRVPVAHAIGQPNHGHRDQRRSPQRLRQQLPKEALRVASHHTGVSFFFQGSGALSPEPLKAKCQDFEII